MRRQKAWLVSTVLGFIGAAWLGACVSGDPVPSSPSQGPASSDGDGDGDGDGGVAGGGGGDRAGEGGNDSMLYPPSTCQRVGDEVQLTQGADLYTMSLLWDTDHYLLAYTDRTQGASDILTLRLGVDGVPQGVATVVVATPGVSKAPRMIKLASGDYLLVWEEGLEPAGVNAVALDPSGAPKGAPVQIATSAGKEARPIVAAGPQGPIIAWMEGIYPSSQAFVAQFDAAGAFLPASKKALGEANAGFPHIAGNASGSGVVFSQTRGAATTIDFGLLDASLELTNRQSLRAPTGDARLARIGGRGVGFIAAWEDFRLEDEQVFMALVDQTGTKSADALVENPGTGSANWPSIASKDDGSASAIVYYQYRKNRPQIFLAYIDAAGTKVGGDLQVSNTPMTANAKYPEIQWSGSNFGVTWVDTRGGGAQAFFAAVSCP